MSANFNADICDAAAATNNKSATHYTTNDNTNNYNNYSEKYSADFQNFPQSYSSSIHTENGSANNSAGTNYRFKKLPLNNCYYFECSKPYHFI